MFMRMTIVVQRKLLIVKDIVFRRVPSQGSASFGNDSHGVFDWMGFQMNFLCLWGCARDVLRLQTRNSLVTQPTDAIDSSVQMDTVVLATRMIGTRSLASARRRKGVLFFVGDSQRH